MKKILLFLSILSFISISTFFACDKIDDTNSSLQPSTEALAKKGGNGKGPNSGGGGSTINRDSLLTACGMTISDTGCWFPTVQLNNIQWRHQTGYSYNPNTGQYDYPYDILVLTFDAPTIAGKTIDGYMLLADQCQGRPVCNKTNGIYVSQVTTNNPTTTFWLPIGTSWLNPNVQQYTGLIQISTVGGCLYTSQPFTFEPPRIL